MYPPPPLLTSSALVPPCLAQGSAPALSEEGAHAIGVAAYLYLYPLVTIDLTGSSSRT